jgi:DNA-binding IclR family transcriptional regulator
MINGKCLPLEQHAQQHKDTCAMVLRSGRKSIHVDKFRITLISQYFKARLKYEGRVLNMDDFRKQILAKK